MKKRSLIVVGAGPKALAIAAKAKVLASLGARPPMVHIIEKKSIASHWSGGGEYTNGRLKLGTPPEKDVGFPYRSRDWGKDLDGKIDAAMLAFSWQGFLVATGGYADWVDRGKPPVPHAEWAEYLKWVAEQVTGAAHFHQGEAIAADLDGRGWNVTCRESGESGRKLELSGDGLVLTGPGRLRVPEGLPSHPRVLTLANFWNAQAEILARPGARVAVVGCGEGAASVVLSLCGAREQPRISIVTCLAVPYSRGESYQENRAFSSPEDAGWDLLSDSQKREFLSRTDRGVFSPYAQGILNEARNVSVVAGRFVGVETGPEALCVQVARSGGFHHLHADYVVVAGGFDPLGLAKTIFSPATIEGLCKTAGIGSFTSVEVEPRIDASLALAGCGPRLHLPSLAAMTQGPGFPMLSCLGKLSDRILLPYLEKGEE